MAACVHIERPAVLQLWYKFKNLLRCAARGRANYFSKHVEKGVFLAVLRNFDKNFYFFFEDFAKIGVLTSAKWKNDQYEDEKILWAFTRKIFALR